MTVYLDAGTSTLEIVPYVKALTGMTSVTIIPKPPAVAVKPVAGSSTLLVTAFNCSPWTINVSPCWPMLVA